MAAISRARAVLSGLVAAVLLSVAAPVASAAMVTFEFSGTLLSHRHTVGTDPAVDDSTPRAVSGSLTFDTSTVAQQPSSPFGGVPNFQSYSDVTVSAALTIDGTTLVMPAYPQTNGLVRFQTSPELLAMSFGSIRPGPDRAEVSLYLGWFGSSSTYDGLSGDESLDDALALPLPESVLFPGEVGVSGKFVVRDLTCNSLGTGCVNDVTDDYRFTVESITRTFAPAPVPLPGALLFLSSGCAALGFMRRRRSGVQDHAAAA